MKAGRIHRKFPRLSTRCSWPHLCSAHPTPGRLAVDLPPTFGASWQHALKRCLPGEGPKGCHPTIDEMTVEIYWNDWWMVKYDEMEQSEASSQQNCVHLPIISVIFLSFLARLRFSDWFFSACCRVSKPCSISSNRSWSTWAERWIEVERSRRRNWLETNCFKLNRGNGNRKHMKTQFVISMLLPLNVNPKFKGFIGFIGLHLIFAAVANQLSVTPQQI